VTLTVQIDDSAFKRAMRRAPEVMTFAARDGVERGLAGFRKEWKPTVKSQGLQRASRWLFVSFAKGETLDKIEGRFFPRKYHGGLKLLERGGVVNPKEGSHLAIPLPHVRKRGGKGNARKGFASPTVFKRKFRRRKLVKLGSALVEFRKQSGKYEARGPVFALVKSKRVKRTLNLLEAWRRGLPRFIERINKTIRDKGLKKVFGTGAVK